MEEFFNKKTQLRKKEKNSLYFNDIQILEKLNFGV